MDTKTAKLLTGLCLTLDCNKPLYTRGVCHSCYNYLRNEVRRHRTTWDQLISHNKILPSKACSMTYKEAIALKQKDPYKFFDKLGRITAANIPHAKAFADIGRELGCSRQNAEHICHVALGKIHWAMLQHMDSLTHA